MPGADAFLGKITPAMLARADRLAWVQSFTASLEHYMFPALVDHPCVLTNVRGLFGDVIADQVMGYVLCFARNLHTYIRQQVEHRYEPAGGESARVEHDDRARDGQRDGSGDDLPSPRHDGDRRHGRDRLRDRAASPGVWDDGARRRPLSRSSPAARGRGGRSRASTGCPNCWAGATSP